MIKNIFQMLRDSAIKFNDKALYSFKVENNYKDISYKDFFEKVKYLVSGLKEIGIKKGDKIFLFSDNRLEWILLDFAFQGIGAVTIPRGIDTGVNEAGFILKHSGSNYIVIENSKAEAKIKNLKYKCKRIAVENNVVKADYYFDKIMKLGIEKYPKNKKWIEKLPEEIKNDRLVTIIYTSGTAGNPKGVMLTHKNFLHDIINSPLTLPVSDKDVTISVLPIWHIFERTVEYVMIYSGANVYYSSIKTFVNDIKVVMPTMVIVVPRILEAFYDKVNINISKMSFVKKSLFNFIYKTSLAYFNLDSYAKRTIEFYKNRAIL